MNEKIDACDLNDLISRVAHLENQLFNANSDEIANQEHNKRINLLIHGLKKCAEEVWEDKNLAIFEEFLKNGLKLDLRRANVIDTHQLPLKLVLRRGVKINRLIIVKLSNVFDKKLILPSSTV